MATKIIKALVNGVVQNIEVEDMTSPEQPLSVEERVDILEDKHDVVITDGNFLVGNGTTELEEITPEEALEHINGATVATMTTSEYEALTETNANTLYMLTDADDELITPDDIDEICGRTVDNITLADGVMTILGLAKEPTLTESILTIA